MRDLQSPPRYRYDLAGNACRCWGCKKYHSVSNIFSFGPALRILWFHRRNVRRRIHKSWRHGIHANPGLPTLEGEGSRQSLNPRLGTVVGNHVSLRQSGTREIDDGPSSGSLHMRKDLARHQKRAEKIVAYFCVPIIETVLDSGLVAS